VASISRSRQWVALCERGYQASAEVTDAAYLFPYLLTGRRAHLAQGGPGAAEGWADRVGAAGLTNRQIADRLVLAPKTISAHIAHIAHILAKLGAARRAEIAAWCATIRPQR
jgi:hypothetical protein